MIFCLLCVSVVQIAFAFAFEPRMTEREFALDVVSRLQAAGYTALWAGGCVRDELVGLTPKDYDVATDARPEAVQSLFRRTIAVGASFGVIEVIGPKQDWGFPTVEVATFRSDGAYADGRHPSNVVFSTPEEDAQRRDFTINGMFFDPVTKTLHDFVGGRDDLAAKRLRAIGDPRVRFGEDKLRMLRAVRIAARFDLTLDPATEAALRDMAHEIPIVSAERIADELRKILVHPSRVRGLNWILDLGLADAVLPELGPMHGLPQGLPQAPTGDLWDHVMAVMEALGPEPSFPLAMGALLHDVGKPRTVGRTPERYTFYGHEHVGARMASDVAKRLKLSTAERDRVVWLVEKHQYLADARQMRPSKIKTLLAHPGIRELLTLHRADAVATGRSTDHVDYCEFLLSLWTEADLSPPPLLTGHDLTRRGYTPGPNFKVWLDAVREAQLDGTITSPEHAWAIVEKLASPS
jgi:poly(A) polymerase